MALKEKLGDEDYAELIGLINPPGSGPAMAWLKGALKSWTNWFGALLIAAPDIIPAIMPNLQELLTADSYKRVVQVAGIIVILLRVKTTTSLAEKGKT